MRQNEIEPSSVLLEPVHNPLLPHLPVFPLFFPDRSYGMRVKGTNTPLPRVKLGYRSLTEGHHGYLLLFPGQDFMAGMLLYLQKVP
jgi:hypothetical protein